MAERRSLEKRIIIIAGPNGAGKTTFAREYLLLEVGTTTFINVDLIAAGLSPFAPELVARRAGRLMLNEIDCCGAAGISFALETTLAGEIDGELRILRDAEMDRAMETCDAG